MAGRVLIVEDHTTMRRAMRLALEELGVEIDETSDGTSALERVRANPPDLVLLDLSIPGTSGEDVLAAMKGDPATAGVRVIVVTAAGEESRARLLAAGADAYFTKPFGPRALLTTVARALAGSSPSEA
jgi:two-component system, OmpR family, alkaline phosphatase synthesis response regulator PhoP